MGDKGERIEGLIRELMEESRNRWERMEASLGDIRRDLEEWKMREEGWMVEKEEIKERLNNLERKWGKRGREG
ncbi:unnamed protein product [Lasius platythorax]|uniref:Uncharacterized protein n=1 Tax=Lasius platythorax TaxID=488582 RepID=A0AAV2NKS4_9HYME